MLDLSKLLMYKTYYDKLNPYSGEITFDLHYIDTDAFVLSLNISDNIKCHYLWKD